jgi:uncharacterized protein (TIGR01777 family)
MGKRRDMKGERIILAGGSGFLGRLLSQYLSGREYEVVLLSRRPAEGKSSGKQVQWDGQTLGPWADYLNGACAVINLAGRSVNCRYNARNRREIMDSRINSTRVLGAAIARCANPPGVWLNSSTATIYKHSLERSMDESGEIGATPEAKDAFSVEVAREWERTFEAAQTPATRKVALRTAMVLGTQAGTVLHVLSRLIRSGLGGQMGNGKQSVSWIHESDFCRAIEWLIAREDLRGPINVTAPNPVPNHDMMRTLRSACGKSFGLPATRWMLEIGAFVMQTETELIIKSRRVVPGRLLASGFEFRFPRLEGALSDLLPKMHN